MTASPLGWRVGVELELMAPPGRTRRDLAERLAGPSGRVEVFFQPQSEPSKAREVRYFHSLTLGFRAVSGHGAPIADCVDDLTLIEGLQREAPSLPGWFRVVSDDRRLLALAARHATTPTLHGVTDAMARLFGTVPEPGPRGLVRVTTASGEPVCIAAPLPGERHRPCELITPPIEADAPFGERLEALLGPARSLGFAVPPEAATHLHLDGERLRSADAIANLAELHATWAAALRAHLRTNPRCRRLGPNPDALLEVVRAPGFRQLPWPRARERLEAVGLSKYVDLNLRNLVHPIAGKRTLEVRMLPGAITTEPVLRWARLWVAIARRCAEGPPVPQQPARDDIDALLAGLERYAPA